MGFFEGFPRPPTAPVPPGPTFSPVDLEPRAPAGELAALVTPALGPDIVATGDFATAAAATEDAGEDGVAVAPAFPLEPSPPRSTSPDRAASTPPSQTAMADGDLSGPVKSPRGLAPAPCFTSLRA